MKGTIDFELYRLEDNEVIESIQVNNAIMDNVIKWMAGSAAMDGDFSLGIGEGFNNDESRTDLSSLVKRIWQSPAREVTHPEGTRYFTFEMDIRPTEANGNLIEIGLYKGNLLYNRAIFKKHGTLPDNTSYDYIIIGSAGNDISQPSESKTAITGESGNKNSIILSWDGDSTLSTTSYYVYRRRTGTDTYYLLTTTSKTFLHDNGSFNESQFSRLPNIFGNAIIPTGFKAESTTLPIPSPITKTEEFAARAKITITF